MSPDGKSHTGASGAQRLAPANDELHQLTVLVLDAQATGATPEHGALLELGWACMTTNDAPSADKLDIESHVVALPDGHRMPARVAKITGIGDDELTTASPRETAWARLEAAAGPYVPTVVHFARFETPFLHQLHLEQSPASPFPFTFICTHEIAKRLLPELPRRGLRALAGYLGHSTHELRRSAAHVAATAFVWRRLIERLAQRERIQTLTELRAWLAVPVKKTPKSRHVYPMPKGKRLAVPDCPGVYRMLRRDGDVLYIGKATSLRTRVNSYFRRRQGVPDRTLEMLTQAHDLSVTPTSTALEAALLEHDEIKRVAPPYNVALVDDGREVWFASTGFASWSTQASRRHRWGPFISPQPFEALRALAAALSDVTNANRSLAWSEIVRLPEPAREHVALGLADLSRELQAGGGATPRSIDTQALLRFAHRRHAERLSQQPRPADETSPSSDALHRADELTSDASDDDVWTASRISAIAHATMHAAALACRRATWWCALTEATLIYSTHRLVIEGGQVVATDRVPYRCSAPRPRHWNRPQPDRRGRFDKAMCDRLRVLTTELRREVAERQHIELRLGPSNQLDRSRLAAALRWV